MAMPPLPGPGTPAPEEEPSAGTSPVLLALVVLPILGAAYYFLTKPAPPKDPPFREAPVTPVRTAPPSQPPVQAAPQAAAASSLDMLKGGSELMQDAQPQESPGVKAMAPTPSSKKSNNQDPKKKGQLKPVGNSNTGSNWNWQH